MTHACRSRALTASRGVITFLKDASVVLKRGESVDEMCCLSVLASSRTVDLVALDNRVRDDWLWALRMLVTHINTTGSLRNIANQRKVLGPQLTSAGSQSAADILTASYTELTFEVQRTGHGMGIVMDSASNVVCELEEDGTGVAAGLRRGDLILKVDQRVVTSIVDGKVVPRTPVTAALDPNQNIVRLTVFRPAAEGGAPAPAS